MRRRCGRGGREAATAVLGRGPHWGGGAGDLVSAGPSSGQEVGAWDLGGSSFWVFDLHASVGFPQLGFPSPS